MRLLVHPVPPWWASGLFLLVAALAALWWLRAEDRAGGLSRSVPMYVAGDRVSGARPETFDEYWPVQFTVSWRTWRRAGSWRANAWVWLRPPTDEQHQALPPMSQEMLEHRRSQAVEMLARHSFGPFHDLPVDIGETVASSLVTGQPATGGTPRGTLLLVTEVVAIVVASGALILLAIRLVIRVRSAQRLRRAARGRCPECSYALAPDPHSPCPECGAVPKDVIRAAIRALRPWRDVG